jgi:hypothetical protein
VTSTRRFLGATRLMRMPGASESRKGSRHLVLDLRLAHVLHQRDRRFL